MSTTRQEQNRNNNAASAVGVTNHPRWLQRSAPTPINNDDLVIESQRQWTTTTTTARTNIPHLLSEQSSTNMNTNETKNKRPIDMCKLLGDDCVVIPKISSTGIITKRKSNHQHSPESGGITTSSSDSIMAVATPTTATVNGMNEKPRALVTGTSKKSKQNPKLVEFAPSISQYLKQEPQRFSPHMTVNSSSNDAATAAVAETNGSDGGIVPVDHPPLPFPVGKYLPRPEWFFAINCIIKAELKAIKNRYDFDLFDVMGSYYGCDYDRHLEYCVRKNDDRHIQFVREWLHTKDAECECISSVCYDLNEYGRKQIQKAHTELKESFPKKMHFVKEQLKTHVIYFDHDAMIWKSQKTIPNFIRTRCRTIPSSQPPLPDIYQITYKSIIQQRHRNQQNFHDDKDTVLHTAIQENATNMALEIIRIEYQTFLYCVCQKIATNQQLHLTLLGAANDQRMTPLDVAAQKGNIVILQELLQCGIPLFDSERTRSNGSIVFQAAKYGQIEVMEYIIDYYHANINKQSQDKHSTSSKSWPKRLKDVLDKPKQNGTTPLMCAAQKGHISVVKLLLQFKALVNCWNNAGMTPLLFAAQSGHVQICRLLLKHGACTDLLTSKSSSALMLACKRGHIDVVKELLVKGCYLYHKDKNGRTAERIIQNRIDRRRENREEQNRTWMLDDNSDGEPGEANIHDIPRKTDKIILRMLNPQSQMEMMRQSIRARRNFEMIRISTLFQQNRAGIKFQDGNAYDVHTAIQCLPETMTNSSNSDSIMEMITSHKDTQLQQQKSKLSKPPGSFLCPSKQLLLRTMLLPKPLIQSIAIFLPLPTLWFHRIFILEKARESNPNGAIIDALDIIDEILEAVGFLSACDTAQIPAPKPHQTWCDWKRSIIMRTKCSNEYNRPENRSRENPVSQEQMKVTESSPPLPRDEHSPTILELRRQVGYLPLLSQYQLHTNIVNVLLSEPYGLPPNYMKKFLRIADIASICRRCCTAAMLPSPSFSDRITFDSSAASDIIDLADDLYFWYENREDVVVKDDRGADENKADVISEEVESSEDDSGNDDGNTYQSSNDESGSDERNTHQSSDDDSGSDDSSTYQSSDDYSDDDVTEESSDNDSDYFDF